MVGRRVDEQLEGARHAGLGGADRDHGAEVPAGRVTADGDPLRVDAQLRGVLDGPLVARPAVVETGREAVLGREPVVHREHPHARPLGQQPAGRVVGVQVAVDHPAAVQEDQQRRRPVVADAGLARACTAARASGRRRRGPRGRRSARSAAGRRPAGSGAASPYVPRGSVARRSAAPRSASPGAAAAGSPGRAPGRPGGAGARRAVVRRTGAAPAPSGGLLPRAGRSNGS